MKITNLMDRNSILLGSNVSTKKEAMDTLIDLMDKGGKISDKATYAKGVYEREEKSTTGIGEGIAIPHCKSNAVKKPGLSAMVVKNGVDFDAVDGEKVDLLFLIAAPESEDNVHLDLLSKLSTLLIDEDFTRNLRNAKNADDFLRVIDEAEAKKDREEASAGVAANANQTRARILGVTGCPTGIAHTYMAAESLEKMAVKMNCSIKVETRGSGGVKNELTAKEIEEADCIIVAADTQVPMDRFSGKKVIQAKVSDGISKAEKLIQRAIDGDAPVYKGSGNTQANRTSDSGDSFGHQLYKHLMSGVSHMLPFVVGGGILIAIAFLLDDYSIDPSNFGSNTPMAAWFKTVGGTAFGFMLPILAGYIAMSIADRPGLVVGFVGGSLASVGATFASPTGDISTGFLGALVAGFLGGYLVLALKKIFEKMPKALDAIKPILIYPLAGILLIAVILCAIDPFVAMLNTGLSNLLSSMGGSSRILLGCILGGMMSIDMGGPFNKAAYVFGTGMLAEQTESGFMIMAAVMVGGMVPPLVIALCTTFFKSKFTEADRKSGVVNYVMGLCFISEGAIPFAAADPLRVIPSCIIGSAIAGGLSMLFGCTLRAPHGGVFVFPTIGNVVLYIVALLVGSVVGAVILGLLKKKPVEN